MAAKLKNLTALAEAIEEAKQEIQGSIAALLESSDYSDLIITCSGFTWNVHRAIICPRSKVFKRMLEGGFKESETGVIDLPEEDPRAVFFMILFLYSKGYTCSKLYDSKVQSLTVPPQEDVHECVQHAKVYTLADRYEIFGLKKFALAQFKFVQGITPWGKTSMLAVAREAYDKTIESDRGLKEAVVDLFYQHKELIRRGCWKKDMEGMSELLYDLFTRP